MNRPSLPPPSIRLRSILFALTAALSVGCRASAEAAWADGGAAGDAGGSRPVCAPIQGSGLTSQQLFCGGLDACVGYRQLIDPICQQLCQACAPSDDEGLRSLALCGYSCPALLGCDLDAGSLLTPPCAAVVVQAQLAALDAGWEE